MFRIALSPIAFVICLILPTGSHGATAASPSPAKTMTAAASPAKVSMPKSSKSIKRKPTALMGKINCYEFLTPNISDIEAIIALVPEKVSGDYFFMNLSAIKGENYFIGSFSCAISSAQNYSCAGDDDAGRYELRIEKNSATLKIKYLNFGNPDQEGPSLAPSNSNRETPFIFKGVSASCR